MGIIFSHPTGNANSRAVATSLLKAELLDQFHTTIASFPGSIIDSLGNLKPLNELHRRRYDPGLKPFTKMWPLLESMRLLASKAGFAKLHNAEKSVFSIDAVYRSLDRKVARDLQKKTTEKKIVYAYEDGALCSFRKAKELGLGCVYDLPIGYWRAARKFLQVEATKWPEWASTIKGLEDSQEKLLNKDEELRLADLIFVASSFTAKTLHDCPANLAPIKIIPYGFSEVPDQPKHANAREKTRLKILFVGSLSQRKGIAQLFTAVEALKHDVELTLVGRKATEDCDALNAALAKHNWIPTLPHHLVLKLMRENDVLVFPSLFEGFGLVITEAMSQGTPVITTDRTCGPDVIKNDFNGWIVEAGSSDALKGAIERLIDDRSLIANAGYNARVTASQGLGKYMD